MIDFVTWLVLGLVFELFRFIVTISIGAWSNTEIREKIPKSDLGIQSLYIFCVISARVCFLIGVILFAEETIR